MAYITHLVSGDLTNEKAKLANASFKSSMKTAIKAVLTAENKENATAALALAYKKLDKAQAKGIVHKNFVARHKAQLAAHVNSL